MLLRAKVDVILCVTGFFFAILLIFSLTRTSRKNYHRKAPELTNEFFMTGGTEDLWMGESESSILLSTGKSY